MYFFPEHTLKLNNKYDNLKYGWNAHIFCYSSFMNKNARQTNAEESPWRYHNLGVHIQVHSNISCKLDNRNILAFDETEIIMTYLWPHCDIIKRPCLFSDKHVAAD